MLKKNTVVLLILSLLVFLPANHALGQFLPNASYKAPVYAPDFLLPDLQGKGFRLSSQRGKPVLIFFGTTWCPACRKELPVYKEIYQTYARRGLEVIYINIMETPGKVANFAKANALPFKILLDKDGDIATNYSVIGVPTLVLIDKDGKTIKVTHSTADLPLKKLFPVK